MSTRDDIEAIAGALPETAIERSPLADPSATWFTTAHFEASLAERES